MHDVNNLRAVDLNLLVVLEALLAERHVSRAAVRLNMSQPAVSHALARLRELFGDPLLVRRSGGLVPTTRALEVAVPISEALVQLRGALRAGRFDPTRERRAFRLAMSDYGVGIVLPALIRKLRRESPGIDLIVTQASREAMLAQVADGDIDLALGVFQRVPERISATTLFIEDFACLADRKSLGASGRLELDDYFSRPHALVAVRGEADTEIDEAAHAIGRSRRVALILPHWSAAPNLIAGTDLVLTVARRTLDALDRDKSVAIVQPPFAIPSFSFVQIWHERREGDAAHRWLREAVEASALAALAR